MSFEKVKDVRPWGVTNQNSTVRLTTGDSSGGTFTGIVNPFRGTIMWDQAMFVLQGVSVAGGATGGSYTITLETDAVLGVTGLPIARAVGIGPLTKKTVILTSMHNSESAPLPTHINITQTASGGGIWFQLWALARQYRGTFGAPGQKTAERVLQGVMLRGTSTSGQFGDDRGFVASATFTLGTTGNNQGLGRMRLWDSALYFLVTGNSVSGAHDVSIIGKMGGTTVTIASTGNSGTIGAVGRFAIPSNFNGQSPNPTQIIWGVSSAGGVSDGRIIVLAKSGRGQMSKN